jgi:hypothetical protein
VISNSNSWNVDNIGNYWDDYTGLDSDKDGIGEDPYIISISQGVQDKYPLMFPGPEIKVNIPIEGIVLEKISPEVELEYPDPLREDNDKMWYQLGNDPVKIFFLDNGTTSDVAWQNVANGILLIKFFPFFFFFIPFFKFVI